MRGESKFKKTLTRRSMIVGGIQLIAVGGLLSRLYYLQFLKSDGYKIQAENNRLHSRILVPSRGNILDRNNKNLAINRPSYRLVLFYNSNRQASESLKKIGGLLDIPIERYEILKNGLKSAIPGSNIIIKDQMSWNDIVQIEFHISDLSDVSIERTDLRYYPAAHETAHIVGHVGAVTKKELRPDMPLLKMPGFKIGKTGVEKFKDQKLMGKAGIEYIEVNASGMEVNSLKKTSPLAGDDIVLTIDSSLQQYGFERMADQTGSIVVMDVNNGDILAAVSTPSFDPDIFNRPISHEYWDNLLNDKKAPLLNKAISGQYPPGSTFKMIVAMAALEKGIINSDTKIHCPGHFFIDKHRFNCWKASGHGLVDSVSALSESCDVFFYTIAEKMGIDAINEMAYRFGYGQSFKIGLPGEKKGLLPSKEWKQDKHNEIWLPGDTVNSAIGQGYNLSTPLQLAVSTARIANGGYAVVPRIYYDHEYGVNVKVKIDIEQKILDIVRVGMFEAVNHHKGTAYGSRLSGFSDVAMAGKTGTSQVRKITQRGADQSKIPREERHHALFVGYAPYDKPKYSIAVIVEHGMGGSLTAAPIAKDVMAEVLKISSGSST